MNTLIITDISPVGQGHYETSASRPYKGQFFVRRKKTHACFIFILIYPCQWPEPIREDLCKDFNRHTQFDWSIITVTPGHAGHAGSCHQRITHPYFAGQVCTFWPKKYLFVSSCSSTSPLTNILTSNRPRFYSQFISTFSKQKALGAILQGSSSSAAWVRHLCNNSSAWSYFWTRFSSMASDTTIAGK